MSKPVPESKGELLKGLFVRPIVGFWKEFLKGLNSQQISPPVPPQAAPPPVTKPPPAAEPPPVVKSPSVVKPPKPVAVTVGLDFGTCATKCVINLESHDRGRDKFLAIAFPSQSSARGTLRVPTAIGVHNAELVFGEEGDRLPEASVIRSFKMAIPCLTGSWGSYHSPFMFPSVPGHFDICGYRLSATDLATLYLAVILRYVKNQVRRYLGQGTVVSVYLNLAAPLDQLIDGQAGPGAALSPGHAEDDSTARDRRVSGQYIALGQRALLLSEEARNPWPLEEAASALCRVKDQPVLPLSESPAYVVPETLAAIAGFINRPGTQSYRYMTFDVGAGSTDASVFWLEHHDGVIKPWYYASRSLHEGADAIDTALAEVTRGFAGGSPRARRETMQLSVPKLEQHRGLFEGTLQAMARHRLKTFGHGYSKEMRAPLWGDRDRAKVIVLLIGGGCQLDVVQGLADGVLWPGVLGIPTVHKLGLDVTKHVLLPDGHEDRMDSSPEYMTQAHLLLIAEGLANKIVDIPPFGVATENLVRARKRVPVPPEFWWVEGRDEAWG